MEKRELRVYKNIQFGDGINCSYDDFQKKHANVLKGLSAKQKKEAFEVATKKEDSKDGDTKSADSENK